MEMSGVQTERPHGLSQIQELPDSVAESLLFELPREVRDTIYTYCLSSGEAHPIDWPTLHNNAGLQPQLLRTCKIIHDEAAPLLYTSNMMSFHQPSDANMFARAMASPIYARRLTSIRLLIKSSDTRLWMPYLTSASAERSLASDFPNLKNILLRFKSAKWQHNHPPETYISELPHIDLRWTEIIVGLRRLYVPLPSQVLGDEEFLEYIRLHPRAFLDRGDDLAARKLAMGNFRLNELQSAGALPAPNIRAVCVFRVSSTHFNALVGPYKGQPSSADKASRRFLRRDGEPFAGFRKEDFQDRAEIMTREIDPELVYFGMGFFSRTGFANSEGISVALEVYTLDSRKEIAGV
jgi:hypothetical protein